MEQILLAAQTLSTGLIAAWLTLGLRDNILHPSINETYTAEVIGMTRMRTDFPDAFARVGHRAITNRRVQRLAFRLVVGAELLAVLALWSGVAALGLGLAGLTSAETARSIALIGALMFTTLWAGFLIVGNHFCYWLCHDGAQNTHYQMTLWGLGTMLVLMQG